MVLSTPEETNAKVENIDVFVSYVMGGDFYLALSDSIYEFPEALRRQPRYHEFWQRPGMPELAAVRCRNGFHVDATYLDVVFI